ncbi:MAG TPA: hypothetical protein VFO09_05500 [Methyloceanibacter sp.]|nr:hypothetical protein [Methyloceanibacter sp.]
MSNEAERAWEKWREKNSFIPSDWPEFRAAFLAGYAAAREFCELFYWELEYEKAPEAMMTKEEIDSLVRRVIEADGAAGGESGE